MKVILFMCMLALLLFFYNFQEGLVGSPYYDLLIRLKETEYEEKTLGQIKSEHINRIRSREDQIANNEERLKDATDNKRKVYTDRILLRKTEIVKFQSVVDLLDKLMATGRVDEGTTIRKALQKEENYIAKLNKKEKNESDGFIALDYKKLEEMYGSDIKNPNINPFVYVKIKYGYSDKETLEKVINGLKTAKLKDWSNLLLKEMNESKGKITKDTRLDTAIKSTLPNTLPPSLNKNESIYVILKNDKVYANKPDIGWTSKHTLGYITVKLKLINDALEQNLQYMNTIAKKTDKETSQFNSIKAHREYVRKLRDRIVYQLIQGRKEPDYLEKLLTAKEYIPS